MKSSIAIMIVSILFFIALVTIPDAFAEERYQWSLMGSDGYMWDYYTVDTRQEIEDRCGYANGCTDPPHHRAYALESVRYQPSDKPCLTVEEHELLHVLGWWHGDMILFCLQQLADELQEKYPHLPRASLEQMVIQRMQ